MPNKMNYFKSNKFHRELLPNPGQYFREQGLKLTGGGEWKSALCPFHSDTRPSLRLRLDSGGFICMVCGTKGGNVLDIGCGEGGFLSLFDANWQKYGIDISGYALKEAGKKGIITDFELKDNFFDLL